MEKRIERRRDFLKGVAAGVGVMVAGCVRGRSRGTSRSVSPNVVYVFSDQHRVQSMSFTEAPTLPTPNMARMAEEGVRFNHCVSNYPLCSPHRAILLTGRWPFQQGVIENEIPLSASEMTVARAFQAAGYRTAYIGKWHLGGTRAEPYGFEDSLVWTGDGGHWDISTVHPANGEPFTPKGYSPTLMVDSALDYIEKRKDERFFLMLSIIPPHPPWDDAPADWLRTWTNGELVPQRPNETDALTAAQRQAYHAHTAAVDAELGRILDGLERLGLADRTVVCYSSDHGEMLGAHGLIQKRQPYEESIAVPFLAWGPQTVPAGRSVDSLFGTVDIMPTLLGLAGVTAPPSCAGQDYSPWLRGETGPDPEYQPILHSKRKMEKEAPSWRGLRTKSHTYVLLEKDGRLYPWLLFDNNADPYQLSNMVTASDHTSLRNSLDGVLGNWLKASNDPCRFRDT